MSTRMFQVPIQVTKTKYASRISIFAATRPEKRHLLIQGSKHVHKPTNTPTYPEELPDPNFALFRICNQIRTGYSESRVRARTGNLGPRVGLTF